LFKYLVNKPPADKAIFAQVLMLTLVAIYAPEGKKGTWFALMASLMNIALSAGGLLTKYLNKVLQKRLNIAI
jgi:hypothetical protein